MNDYLKLNEAALRFIGVMEMAPCDIVARVIYRRAECGTAWKTLKESGQVEHNHRKNGNDLAGCSWLRLTRASTVRLGVPESRSGPMTQATLHRALAAYEFCFGNKDEIARRAEPSQVAAILGTEVPDNVAWCVSKDCIWRLYVADTSIAKIVATVRDQADKLTIDDATRPFVQNGQLGIGIAVPTVGAAAAIKDALRERAIGEPVGNLIRTRVIASPTLETLPAWLKSFRTGGKK